MQTRCSGCKNLRDTCCMIGLLVKIDKNNQCVRSGYCKMKCTPDVDITTACIRASKNSLVIVDSSDDLDLLNYINNNSHRLNRFDTISVNISVDNKKSQHCTELLRHLVNIVGCRWHINTCFENHSEIDFQLMHYGIDVLDYGTFECYNNIGIFSKTISKPSYEFDNTVCFYHNETDLINISGCIGAFKELSGNIELPWFLKIQQNKNWYSICKQI